jgi:hypothetical protein
MMVTGVTIDAIMGLIETKTKRQEDRKDTVEISAADVVDHMLARIPWWRCSFFRNA